MSRRRISLSVALVVLLGAIGVGGWFGYDWVMTKLTGERCYISRADSTDPLALTAEQAQNASIIVAASYVANLPEQAAVVALATAWQESGLRNLNYGDRDSLGLFQQRPSYGWGTPEQILDPWYSADRFYKELVKFKNWETTDVNDIAQKVQRSGHPQAYRKHVANAVALAGALRGSRAASLGCIDRSGQAGEAAAFAKQVAAVPGVSSNTTGNTITLSATDPTALWSATQLALATGRSAGIVRVTVGDQFFEVAGRQRSWGKTNSPAPAAKALIVLRGN